MIKGILWKRKLLKARREFLALLVPEIKGRDRQIDNKMIALEVMNPKNCSFLLQDVKTQITISITSESDSLIKKMNC